MSPPLPTRAGAEAQPITAAIAEQAMQWQLDLQQPPISEATLSAWRNWRQAHPLHEKAWLRAEAFAQRMDQVRQQGHSALASATLGPSLRPALSRRTALKQLGVLLAVGAGAWNARDLALVQDWSADYSTRVGQQRRLTLVDQTRVQLNTDSAIKLRFDQDLRRISLLRGEMLVTLDRQSGLPPLSVDTAEGRIETVAARFNVRQAAGVTLLGVYEGSVQVQPRNPGQPALTLNAGEQLRFDRQGLLSRQPQGASQPAWSQGMLAAQGQRLADFLEELGRYRPGHLGCDSSLADLPVSGTFPLADTDRVLNAVAETLHLEVRPFTRYWVTLKPRTLAG